jgi:DNA-binding transcriptional LysR family regulator
MTLKQLEAFYWAATLGTFAIAARRLHVTQSSLSKRIAELEADLGHQLFDRNSRRATLTAAGEVLLGKAQAMLEFERDIRSSLHNRDEHVRGVCRIGLTELAATTWFPAFATHLEAAHPQVVLEPTVTLSKRLETAVARGELDVACIAGSVSTPELQSLPLAEIEFVWTSAPTRLHAHTVLHAEHFESHPVISNPQDSGLSAAFDAWAAANRIQVGKTIPCNSRGAIIALTIAGAGISFQPRAYIQPLLDQGLLVPLECQPPMPNYLYHLVWRRDDDRLLVSTVMGLLQKDADFTVRSILWGNKAN